MRQRKIVCAVAAAWLAIFGAAFAAPAASEKPGLVTSVEGISEYRLANGLRVLLFPDPSKPTVTVNITYVVGSRNEGYGETGMAHLLEHMLFKGSKNHLKISEEMRSHGARNNASTWYDRTNYFETVDASDANLRWALELEADRMVNSFVARKDLDSEMTVVRNEFEMNENRPARILEERVLSTAFLWHNYGHSTIGARSDIENVPIDRLQAFYRNYYQPDNAVLLVAGKFEEAKTLTWIQEIFSQLPRPTRVIQTTYTREPVQDGEREVTLKRAGDVQALAVAFHVCAGPSPDFPAVEILTQLLADTPSGRLHKALVETQKASSVDSDLLALREPGFLVFSAEVRADKPVEDARRSLLETIDAVTAHPPTKEEVDRARATLLKDVELTLNQSGRLGLQLSEWIAAGDWRLFFVNRDRIKAVTPEDVKRVASAYLKPSNRTVGTFLPTPHADRAEIPEAPPVAEIVKDYKGEAAMAAGEAFDPSPDKVESRIHRSSLTNEMKLALLPKKTRRATVVAALTLRFGEEASLHGLSTPAELAAEMLMRGTKNRTRQQIRDELDRLKARVSVSGGPTQATVSVETVRENLAAVLKLVAEVLREPSFPEKEFDLLKQESLAELEQRRSEPQAIAPNAYSKHLNPYPKGDVRYVDSPEEEIEQVKAATLADARRFHADFYGTGNAQFAIAGDFEEKETHDLLESLFGGWKSARPFARVPRLFKDVAPIDRAIETPDKANAMFVAGENLEMRDDDSDYPAMVLGNYIFGAGSMSSRLGMRIRQKEGLSYGVGSQFSASPLDRAGTFTIFAICAPQNAGKVQTAVREELAKLLKDGFTEEEISVGKKGWLQGRQVSRGQDGELARTLATDLFLDRTLLWDRDLEAKIGKLTGAEIVAALRRHLRPETVSYIRVGDFAKKTGPETKP